MRINEFIRKTNEYCCVFIENDESIGVYPDNSLSIIEGDWFLKFDPKTQEMDAEPDWECADFMDPFDMYYVLKLVKELHDTPVKERFLP